MWMVWETGLEILGILKFFHLLFIQFAISFKNDVKFVIKIPVNNMVS